MIIVLNDKNKLLSEILMTKNTLIKNVLNGLATIWDHKSPNEIAIFIEECLQNISYLSKFVLTVQFKMATMLNICIVKLKHAITVKDSKRKMVEQLYNDKEKQETIQKQVQKHRKKSKRHAIIVEQKRKYF